MAFEAVLLFDGSCGLCHRLVVFLARRDHARRLCFAPLDGGYSRELLAQLGIGTPGADEAVLVAWPEAEQARAYCGARAALTALTLLTPGWNALARCLLLLPVPLLNWGYRCVARRRYRWFGTADACALDPGLLEGRLPAAPATESQ